MSSTTTQSIIPGEILHTIYDFSTYGEHCMINKDIYQYKKDETINRFYIGVPTQDCCGHCNAQQKIIMIYKIVSGYTIDEYDGTYSRNYIIQKFDSCKPCFYLAFIKFYKEMKRVPYLRCDGCVMYHYISKMREMPKDAFLSIISNTSFQKIMCLEFEKHNEENHNEYYRVDYSNRNRYEEILRKLLEDPEVKKFLDL